MKKDRRYAKENNGLSKKQITAIICCAVAVILCTAIFITCFTFFGCGNNTATQDEANLVEVENEDAYIFSEGIFIGSANAAGKSYRQMREAAEKELEGLIKTFTITVTAEDKTFKFANADFSFDNNIDLLLRQAATYNDSLIGTSSNNKTKTFEITFEVNKDSVKAKAEEIAKEVDVEPKSATIGETGDSEVGVLEATLGKKINQTKLIDVMCKEINSLAKGEKTKSDPIKAVIEETQPELTFDDLDGKITLLSSYTSVSTNTANGNHNMALALNSCNGSVIQPGETWSFNACTGNSNLTSLGYLPATVISGGKYETGIGGGLCQSSTTIYNAAIRTNMVIVERYCHYFKSSYADAGLDATIDWPGLDLKLKNPTEYPMYLQCFMAGNTLYCNIYGYQDPSFDEVQISSYIYEANYDKNYFRASATRTFLKDGEVVWEEQLPDSRYHYYSPEDETTAPTETTGPSDSTETTGSTDPTDTTTTETVNPDNTQPETSTTSPLPTDPVETTPSQPSSDAE